MTSREPYATISSDNPSFGTCALAHERNVVKVPADAPLELLGPLGCGIQTWAGAVMNVLKVRSGSSFTAFGGGARPAPKHQCRVGRQ